jgi:integrase
MSPNLGKLILLYMEHAPVAARTAHNNSLSILKMLEKVRGHPVQPQTVQLTEINASLVSSYQRTIEERYAEAAEKHAPAQREARERALRSTRSTIRQARCLFSRRGVDLVQIYRENGIEIPECVFAFTSAHVRGKNTKRDYNAPPDSVVENAIESIELMRKDASVFIGFWIAIGAGLRRSEIKFCRWEYLVEINGRPRIIGGLGKDAEVINVPLQSRAFEAILPFRKDSGWMIEDRGGGWCKRLCGWMRNQGFGTRLLIHELRAFLGSQLYRESPVLAMRVLRHKNLRTTESSYIRYGKECEGVDVL